MRARDVSMAIRTAWWALRNWERLSMLHFGMLRDAQVYRERTLSLEVRYWTGYADAAGRYSRGFDGAPFQTPNEEAV